MEYQQKYYTKRCRCAVFIGAGLLCASVHAGNQQQVTFTDIAAGLDAGITYERFESPSQVIYDAIRSQGPLFFADAVTLPANNRGAPGVATFDYDNDGDIDIYVTNGPGKPNSLYANQLRQTGETVFIDVAEQAGIAALEQDSTGVCYGDIDNDNDFDVLVLGAGDGNLLYENLGTDEFREISFSSGIGGTNRYASSCTMGDINNDGLLDIAIANSWNDWSDRFPLMTLDFNHRLEHNQLYKNQGSNIFTDISQSAGILAEPRVTWAIALVDYDLDGDADLITADDHGPRLPARYGGVDMGYVRVYENDGSGAFIDRTVDLRLTDHFGGYMSLSFGDLNHDGYMDIFTSNVGDYSSFNTAALVGHEKVKGEWGSTWFLGAEDSLMRADTGAIGATVFGWGSAITDYDNDGDSDIVFHGGLDFALFQDGSNPGAMLNNGGVGDFSYDRVALANSTGHARRNVRGVAVADLDDNGFMDIVSVSNQNWPQGAPLVPYPDIPIGGQFDQTAVTWPTFFPLDPANPAAGFQWSGIEEENGTLSIEMNNGESRNRSVTVSVRGSVGITPKGRVNRSGVGAVVSFTPKRGETAMRPFVSGGSYASQHSHEWVFGLGRAKRGTLEVLWSGGTRNKLYNVRAGEKISLPEIPCSYDDQSLSFGRYLYCLGTSLTDLYEADVVNRKQKSRLFFSAIRAYLEAR